MEYDFSESLDFVEEVVQGSLDSEAEATSSKSVQKIKFTAEIESIKRNYGNLEDMRSRLGLSRRKMCEQLMVDPSAWTRWTHADGNAPPHVYKTMALLLAKFDLNPQIFVQDTQQLNEMETQKAIDAMKIENQSHLEAFRFSLTKLQSQFEKREVLTFGWKLLLILNFALIVYVLIR